MKLTDGSGWLLAGVDFREETPNVCYQTEQMKEPERLPLDFGACKGRQGVFRKILSALKKFAPKEQLRAAVVLPDTEEETIRLYLKEACEAGFDKEQLQVLGETESLVHFTMHQPPDIWQQEVCFLEFGPEEIRAMFLKINRRTAPMLVEAVEPEYWHVGNLLDGSRDERLAEAVKERFGKQHPVSAVFLTGTDLNAADYRKSREELCFHRRVFLAEQIYARGACMLAGDGDKNRSYLFLNEQTLHYNVNIRSVRAGREQLYTLVSAGCSWYEAKASCEMLLMDEPVLEFVFSPMTGGEPVREGLLLTDIPGRPAGASRVLVELWFSGVRQCEVKVSDLGFGELYPASDLYWRETFWLEEEGAYGFGDDLQI